MQKTLKVKHTTLSLRPCSKKKRISVGTYCMYFDQIPGYFKDISGNILHVLRPNHWRFLRGFVTEVPEKIEPNAWTEITFSSIKIYIKQKKICANWSLLKENSKCSAPLSLITDQYKHYCANVLERQKKCLKLFIWVGFAQKKCYLT